MTRGKYFGNNSNGYRGGNYRGGVDRRGGNHMNGNRNGFNNNNNSRPTRFSAKRSRSPSPVRSAYGSLSQLDNGNDFKRPRTDGSRPPHEESRHPFSSASNGHAHPPLSSSTTSHSSNGFHKQLTSYPPPPIPTTYPKAYQMYAQKQPPLPAGPPPS